MRLKQADHIYDFQLCHPFKTTTYLKVMTSYAPYEILSCDKFRLFVAEFPINEAGRFRFMIPPFVRASTAAQIVRTARHTASTFHYDCAS